MIPYATLSLFTIALGHLGVELCSSFLPVVYPVLITTLGLNYAQIGAIAMVAGIGTSVAQPLFGYWADRWNPRRISALSVAWIGLTMGAVGLIGGYAPLLLLVGFGSLGSAAFHPPAATLASACGGSRRGRAVSVFSIGGSLGSALSPLWVTAGINWLGVQGTLILIPVALLISGLIYWQLGRMACAQDVRPAERPAASRKGTLVGMTLIVLAVMSLSWFQVTLKTYLPIWLDDRGLSAATGGQMLFVLLAFLGVGSFVGGALSDHIARWLLFATCMALLAPVVWWFLSASGLLQWLLVSLIGMLVGSIFPVSIVMAQETWPKEVGAASGLVMGLGWLPGGIGASITGLVADRFSLDVGLRTLVVPALLGMACVLSYALLTRNPSMTRSVSRHA
jgi:FSR family fosmidomycin resistance protein-like MFS transporter